MQQFYAAEFVVMCQSLQAIRMALIQYETGENWLAAREGAPSQNTANEEIEEPTRKPKDMAGLLRLFSFVEARAHASAMRSQLATEQLESANARLKESILGNKAQLIELLRVTLDRLVAELEELDLSFSLTELKRIQTRFTEDNKLPTMTELDNVLSRIRDELLQSRFFQLAKEQARYYDADEAPFGIDVANKFASDGIFEIDEAGKCLALDRSTACVFHLMRVLEIAIRAIRKC